MKLICVLFVLIGASLVIEAVNTTTTAAPTTANMTTAITTTAANTTTAAPMTTTTAVMTTTPMPQETTWRLDDSDNATCILEQMRAVFSIQYMMVNTTDNQTVPAMMNFTLPQIATVDTQNSTCGGNGTMPKLTLVFGDSRSGNKFEQVFTMSANNSALTNITLALTHTQALFPYSNQSGQLVTYSATLPSATFMVNNGQCYLCNAVQNFKIDDNSNVTFSKVKVQTADIVDHKFGNVSQCPQDTPSTSPATTTTMTPSMTTTTPFPPPEKWVIKNKDNETCMIFNMSLEFSISYKNSEGKNTTLVKLPSDASSSESDCTSNTTSKFVLTFFKGWKLEMDFSLDNKTKMYNNNIMNFTYTYDDEHFIDPKENGTVSVSTNKTDISAESGKYYSCVNKVQLTQDNVTFIFHDVQIQPFALKANQTLGTPAPCAADEKFNNIVPIAVGCALAGLVIIVLIAYLIGRQRSSKSGYESV